MFFSPQALHFTGIGGIGMSGLAGLCLAEGCLVSGSDLKLNALTARLAERGARIAEGHAAANVPAGACAIVITTAASPNNPEIAEARRRGLPVVRRGELLAELMRGRRGVAVCGSHGKTTTAAMIATVAAASGADPTACIGGRVPQFDGANARSGSGAWFIAEADESDGSFLELSPEIALITNVDREHLDHYGSFAAVQRAFVTYANRVAFYGSVILCLDDLPAARLAPQIRRRVITYGRDSEAALRITADVSDARGSRFQLSRLGEFEIGVLGPHNVLNATAAVAACLELGLDADAVRAGLREFRGVGRRMEIQGRRAGITVVDDYGHHPSEIRATLAALRLTGASRIVVLFQPHRYTRTQALAGEFGAAFANADLVRICDIYAASEPPIAGVTSEALAERVRAAGHADARYSGTLQESVAALALELRSGDLVVTMGAGSVTQAGPELLKRIEG